ncbi:Transmembrane alpha-helix domain [Nakaseomyces glabratus]|nr:Transmembrane alpha-helix domain [Nakaseomyces glabratus]KAH7598217.1 Transmembrane alpha-helix domain [Nakaseomyces glabratus]
MKTIGFENDFLRPTSTIAPTSTTTLFKRDDVTGSDSATSTSSDSDSSSTSTSTKCTGSAQYCEKPTDAHWKETVGIAVGVPVGVIVLGLLIVLILVWKKGKKEADEDLDPEFQSGSEYLPYISNEKHIGGSSTNSSAGSKIDAPYKSRADPFQLPDASTDSLRDFARMAHDPSLDKYKLATSSLRNKSNLSLVNNQTRHTTSGDSEKDSFDFSNNSTTSTLEDESTPIKKMPNNDAEEVGNDTTLNPFESEDDPAEMRPQIIITDSDPSNDDAPLTPREEEDIQRIKSIYNVYLDQNGNQIVVDPTDENKLGNTETVSTEDSENIEGLGIQTGTGIQAQRASRIASSVYSENPLAGSESKEDYFNHKDMNDNVQYDMQSQQQYIPQTVQYPNNGFVYDQQYHDQQRAYYMQHYQQPNAQQMMYYQPPINQTYHQYHPQTLEAIDELPTPTELAYSPSYHSLTSFKKPMKQQLLIKNQIATLNGLTLNPIDHPEMFFTQDDSYSKYQEKIAPMSGKPSNKSPASNVPLPHHLRQSVVMTNPHDLSLSTTHKPAGSFRKVHNAAQSPHLGVDPRYGNNTRVSGLLDDTDVVQPASVGEILPRHGNNDDLRKQLGISHNYHIQL